MKKCDFGTTFWYDTDMLILPFRYAVSAANSDKLILCQLVFQAADFLACLWYIAGTAVNVDRIQANHKSCLLPDDYRRAPKTHWCALAFHVKSVLEGNGTTFVVLFTDDETPHLILQGRAFQAEALGGSASTRDLSGCCLQCLDDHVPFRVMES